MWIPEGLREAYTSDATVYAALNNAVHTDMDLEDALIQVVYLLINERNDYKEQLERYIREHAAPLFGGPYA